VEEEEEEAEEEGEEEEEEAGTRRELGSSGAHLIVHVCVGGASGILCYKQVGCLSARIPSQPGPKTPKTPRSFKVL